MSCPSHGQARPRRVIIDCDPGIDDCMALFLALASRDCFSIEALTIVCGNSGDTSLLARNACLVLQACGRPDIPVVVGASVPLAGVFHGESGCIVHGADGLGNLSPDVLPLPSGCSLCVEPMQRISSSASEYIAELCRAHPHEIHLITLGPLTNIALALQSCPELPTLVPSLTIMGGAFNVRGNKSPVAEANMHNDPDAARAVLRANFPNVTMAGLNVTRTVGMTSEFRERLRTLGAIGRFIYASTTHYINLLARWDSDSEVPMHDPTPIMYLIRPDLFESKMAHVEVESCGEFTKGETIADWRGHWNLDKEGRLTTRILLSCSDADAYRAEYARRVASLVSSVSVLSSASSS
eukprot:gnl/Spiro4/6837_TR3543_c0_g1_i1.p1 gnl/Spiro4/6837_TR3543_c0_g1~~gnl/Spiro4/6837_TR3543_c0_g1_i1.p1  ORF type:complete len:363 (+),score=26.94 gnl/Spiro4/6837_TR3543_c0_g1_i1:33-1091(+)